MRAIVLAATLVVATSAFGQTKRVTRTVSTGKQSIIAGSISTCSIPNLVAPKRQTSSYQSTSSSFAYVVCREYASYEADVTGKSWNTKDAEVPGTRRLHYKLETAHNTSSQNVETYAVRTRDGEVQTYSVSDADWAMTNLQVTMQCSNDARDYDRLSVDVSQTGCRQ